MRIPLSVLRVYARGPAADPRMCRRKVSGGNRPRPRLRLRPRPLLRPDRTVPPRRGIRPGSGSPLGNSGRGPGGARRRNTMFWVLRIFRFDFRRRGRLSGGRCSALCFMPRSVSSGRGSGRSAGFGGRCSALCFMPRSVSSGRGSGRSAGFGGRCSALCFMPRSVSSGRGFGRSADSGVWCSCTAFHAAPVIEKQVRMACVPHSSCLFQIGPAERQHRAAPPAGCRSYPHCTAVCSAQRRQTLPPPAAAGRGHKDFAGDRSAGTFDASRLCGRGGAVGARSPIPIPSGGCGPRRHPSRRVRDVRDRSFRRLRRNDRDRKSQAGAPRPPRRPDPRSSCKAG